MIRRTVALAVLALASAWAQATDYANPGGTGDRRGSVIVAATPGGLFSVTDDTDTVDGVTGSGGAYVNHGGAVAGQWMYWDFGSDKRLITEVTMRVSHIDTEGTWKWQGGNDLLSWTDIGGNFTLGGALVNVYTINTGGTKYSKYRLLGVSGTQPGAINTRWYEVEFKISPLPARLTAYTNQWGMGNRSTAGIVVSAVGGAVSGSPKNNVTACVDAIQTAACFNFVNGAGVAGTNIKIAFPAPRVVDEVRIYMQNRGGNDGVWQWAVSNDDLVYQDFGPTFSWFSDGTLGPIAGSGLTYYRFLCSALAGNVAGYRYYKLYGVSGTAASLFSIDDFEFRIGLPGAIDYLGAAYDSGDTVQ